jgi:hypothetical protein
MVGKTNAFLVLIKKNIHIVKKQNIDFPTLTLAFLEDSRTNLILLAKIAGL